MLSRKEQEKEGILLPENWRQKVETALEELYSVQCEQQNKEFQVCGITYPDEIFISCTFTDPESETIPVTYAMSSDIDESTKSEDLMNKMVDSIGLFFDNYFAAPDNLVYHQNWEETKYSGVHFYYQVTREHIALSIMANNLLNQ